jgi:hypothetical protein
VGAGALAAGDWAVRGGREAEAPGGEGAGSQPGALEREKGRRRARQLAAGTGSGPWAAPGGRGTRER